MYDVLDNITKKILPTWIYNRFIANWDKDGFEKYFHNTGWMFIARVATFITSFLTIAIVARYLGPENLGKLSYAQSFVSIFSVFASLGIDQIVYRDLTSRPEKQYEILGTAIFSKFFFGIVTFSLVTSISIWLNNDPILTILVGIIAFNFLINPIGTVGIFFQSKVKARFTSHVTIFLAFFIPALKLLVIYFDKGIIYFAGLLVIEALIMSIWSLYIYITKFNFNPLRWKFSLDIFIQLMKDSWPFLFAGLFTYIYARIDQVMLQHFLDSTAVGLYDIAVKLTNIWSFIPALVISSLFPAIITAKARDKNEYLKRYFSLVTLVTLVTLAITIPVFLLAKPIVSVVFGVDYLQSVAPLQIYLWAGVIAILGILVQQYLIAENKGWIHLILTLMGALSNVILNLILIPKYGMIGAAWSTILSFSMVPLGLLLFKNARQDMFLMVKNVFRS